MRAAVFPSMGAPMSREDVEFAEKTVVPETVPILIDSGFPLELAYAMTRRGGAATIVGARGFDDRVAIPGASASMRSMTHSTPCSPGRWPAASSLFP